MARLANMEWLRAFYSAMKDKGPFRRCFPLAKDVRLNGRRLQILRQLGEGGYSYVYLVKDLTSEAGERYALKRIWAVTEEQLKAAKHEIDIIRRIDHPNLLQMIDSAIVPKSDESGAGIKWLCTGEESLNPHFRPKPVSFTHLFVTTAIPSLCTSSFAPRNPNNVIATGPFAARVASTASHTLTCTLSAYNAVSTLFH